jgi:hypothetical protein
MPVEKNDIDISKLFEWGKKFTVNWKDKTLDVYIRLVGDAELNRSRVFGLRKSAELRRKLSDYNSEERLAYIPDFQAVTKEGIVGALISYSREDYIEEAVKNVEIKKPKELASDAKLEEQEKHQKEVDEYPDKRNRAILEYITKKFEAKKKELEVLPKKDLYDRFATAAINEVCRGEFLKSFRTMSTYFGSYKDEKFTERLCNSFEEFDNLPTDVKAQLIDSYTTLEIPTEDLKA